MNLRDIMIIKIIGGSSSRGLQDHGPKLAKILKEIGPHICDQPEPCQYAALHNQPPMIGYIAFQFFPIVKGRNMSFIFKIISVVNAADKACANGQNLILVQPNEGVIKVEEFWKILL